MTKPMPAPSYEEMLAQSEGSREQIAKKEGERRAAVLQRRMTRQCAGEVSIVSVTAGWPGILFLDFGGVMNSDGWHHTARPICRRLTV